MRSKSCRPALAVWLVTGLVLLLAWWEFGLHSRLPGSFEVFVFVLFAVHLWAALIALFRWQYKRRADRREWQATLHRIRAS